MYDVIVIGARVAGSPIAMLLARKGYKVLLLDRAKFPSDTISSHQVQLKGVAALKRWGLLDQVMATNCPPINHAFVYTGNYALEGKFPPLDGNEAILCPRRTLLDKVLVDAAVAAGAELREDFLVERLTQSADQVTGVIGRPVAGIAEDARNYQETTRLVIGADGKHSMVARQVNAQVYNDRPVLSCAYYSYWQDVDASGLELYLLSDRTIGVCPTNDGLTMIYTAYPYAQFNEVRKNIEDSFWKSIDSLPHLAARVHQGRLAERFYGSADLPSFYRKPGGPGWALVGDAGMTMDPITGQGIGNAFRDAERLTEAVDAAFSHKIPLEKAFREYEISRNNETHPMYEFTCQAASFPTPTMEQQELFSALSRNPDAASRFLGALTGSISIRDFFSMRSLFQILGVGTMGRVFLSRLFPSMRKLRDDQ